MISGFPVNRGKRVNKILSKHLPQKKRLKEEKIQNKAGKVINR